MKVWFKDKNNEDFNLVVIDVGRRQRAEEQIDTYEIPYRNNDLIIHSGKYKPYTREMEFALLDHDNNYFEYNHYPYYQLIQAEINEWLSGTGKLMIIPNVNSGYFKASVISGLKYEKLSTDLDSFKVSFKVDPFYYIGSGDNIIENPTTLYNQFTTYSEPLIKIYGNGNITLNINSQFIQFTGIEESITIDSDLKVCYRDALNQGLKMVGEFPVLEVGKNEFAWTGNVSKIEVTPRWREL